MKMSVFRQNEPILYLDHLECMKIAVGSEHAEMIMHARLNSATVLVVLQSVQAVVKPSEEADEALHFEDLFDTAITLFDYRKMERQQVRTRDELAPHLYELEINLIQEGPISLRLRLKCKDQHSVKPMLMRLVRDNVDFGTELYGRLTTALMDTEAGSISSSGPVQVMEEAPPEAPEWEFVPPEESS